MHNAAIAILQSSPKNAFLNRTFYYKKKYMYVLNISIQERGVKLYEYMYNKMFK